MFQKFIGKRKKDQDWFHIPEKKYTTDQKVISKMGPNALKDLFADQEKYVNILIEKIQHAKNDYERLNDKVDELQQKNEVVNAQISRMTNEHEELTIKFDNLQTSLEIVSSESDNLYKKEIQFLVENEINCDKIKNLNSLILYYRERFNLCKKIESQNKIIKNKFSQLEEDLEQAENTIKDLQMEVEQLKANSINNKVYKKQYQQSKQNNELDTFSTLKSAEDEELQQKYRLAVLDLQKKDRQISKIKEQLQDYQQQNKDISAKLNKQSQKINASQSELAKLRKLISKYENEIQMNYDKQLNIAQNNQKLNASNKQLLSQINQQKLSNNNLSDRIAELNKKVQSKQKECKQLLIELQSKEQSIQNKQSQLKRQKQNRTAMEGLLSNKNNNQMESLLKIKTKNESQIQQLRQNCDNLKKTIQQLQTKAKQISQQLESVKTSNKRLIQQKKMIQQNANTCLKISQQQSQKSKLIQKDLKKQIEQLKKQTELSISKIKTYQNQIKSFTLQTEKLFKTVQTKEAQLKKNYAYIQELQKQKNNINQLIGQKQQDNKIRIRKYQSQLNQQRIKIENLNRKIANLQGKAQESKISLDSMYEQMLSKDKRIIHMETKLKEYKYIIQVQKKQRVELQQSYEKTVSSLKPTQMPKNDIIQKQNNLPQQTVEKQTDHEKQNLKNELLSIKEQNIVVLSENEALRKKIEEFQQIIHEKTRTIKMLQEKRDQIMKEIQKMNKVSSKNQQVSGNSVPLNSPVGMIRIESKQHQSREKKIAAKAHKGFDILIKLEHQLYKNFINVFATDLSRQEVKGIQGQINSMVKKSSDMRDIFEDYL